MLSSHKRRLTVVGIFAAVIMFGFLSTPFVQAQEGDTTAAASGITIRLPRGTVVITTDGVIGPGSGTGVIFATGTAHCQGGSYVGMGTGNKEGKCKQTQVDANSNTLEYTCDDGKGNSATVNCGLNGGRGVCESTGSGTCGDFKK